MNQPDELAGMARNVIDANRYLTLGTAEPDGRPRLSPVYFTHAGYRDFYWVSSPAARHSENIAARPDVAIVIYDSTAPVGQGRAVYLGARASVVAEDELPRRCAEAFARVGPGAVRFQPEELSGDAVLRLYRAAATSHEVHIPGRDPTYGTGSTPAAGSRSSYEVRRMSRLASHPPCGSGSHGEGDRVPYPSQCRSPATRRSTGGSPRRLLPQAVPGAIRTCCRCRSAPTTDSAWQMRSSPSGTGMRPVPNRGRGRHRSTYKIISVKPASAAQCCAWTRPAPALSGTVNWQYQREAAARAVMYLKGVTAVTNTSR